MASESTLSVVSVWGLAAPGCQHAQTLGSVGHVATSGLQRLRTETRVRVWWNPEQTRSHLQSYCPSPDTASLLPLPWDW